MATKYKKKVVPKAIRMKLWENTIGDTLNGSCYCCKRDLKIDNFEAGHIIAEVNGGKTSIDNLKVLCKPCNTSCGTKNLDEFVELMNSKKEIQVKEEKIVENVKVNKVEPELNYDEKLKLIEKFTTYDDTHIRLINLEKDWKTIANNDALWKKWIELHNKDPIKKIYIRRQFGNLIELELQGARYANLKF